MNAGFEKRLLVVWLVLSAITMVYLWMDHSVDQDADSGRTPRSRRARS